MAETGGVGGLIRIRIRIPNVTDQRGRRQRRPTRTRA